MQEFNDIVGLLYAIIYGEFFFSCDIISKFKSGLFFW